MTTVAALIEETYNHLYGTHRQTLNQLGGTITAGATSLTFTHAPDEAAEGSFLGIDDELLYVVSLDRTTRTAVVLRAQRGSVAAAHTADVVIEINPRFPRFRVKEKLREEIRSWPADLFRVVALDLETANGVAGYDLVGAPADFYSVLGVQLGPRSASLLNAPVHVNWELMRDASTTIFASGAGIVVTSAAPSEARDLRVSVAAPFGLGTWADATDVETACGLKTRMVDIPPFGAAWRLMAARDVKRSFGEGQGEPRRAEEIPPGFAGSVATFLKRTRDQRISDEIAHLRSLYPIRM